MPAIDGPQHVAYVGEGDAAGAVRNRLIKERERVAHAARGSARDERQRLALGRHVFLAQDALEMRGDRRRRHLLQVELQAAA